MHWRFNICVLSLLPNIVLILSTTSKLRFCSELKIFMVSMLAFSFKIVRPIIFYSVKKVIFSQSRKLSTKKFFLIKEIFTRVFFPWSRKFFTSKDFHTVKKISANKDLRDSLKDKLLDPFHTKSYPKIFLIL